jgi:hypothetical protein
MNFSTRTLENISVQVAAEINRLIDHGEIKDIQELENGIREMVKEVGKQTYGKVLEREDRKLGKRVRCDCGVQTRRISRREAKVLTVFGRVSYRRSYYGCFRCGQKHYRLDQDWGIHPGEVSPVLGKLLAIAGVAIAFERARRSIQEFLLVEVSDHTIRKQTQLMGKKQAQLEAQWICESHDEAWLQQRERETVRWSRVFGHENGVC